MEFEEQTVLITGSSTSIGFATAEAFLKAGARVMINGSTATRLKVAVDRLAGFGQSVAGQLADVKKSKDVTALVAATVERFGGLDIVVNGAGISHSCRVVDLSEEEWDLVLDINLKGAFLVSQAGVRAMLAQGRGGRIINITSGAGRSARVGTAPYSASKAGLMMLTKTMAMELGPDGITVNAVSPGLFPAKDKLRPLRPEYLEAYLNSIPLGYYGEPVDVANAVLFLASSRARYITGEVLTIDGGCLSGRFLLPENKKS